MGTREAGTFDRDGERAPNDLYSIENHTIWNLTIMRTFISIPKKKSIRNCMALILIIASIISAPAFATSIQFNINQDSLCGSLVDAGKHNHPIRASDKIFVRDGHFYKVGADLKPNTQDDERVRFFGINLSFGANFPTSEDAPRIARRLRCLGFNLIRLHHLDTRPTDNGSDSIVSVLENGPFPTFNAAAIQRLRNFINHLSNEGIYINLNLHVGYRFRPEQDDVPKLPPDTPMPEKSKPLFIFDPNMIKLQAKYATNLINKLNLAKSPALAMVEISNESSLVFSYLNGTIKKNVTGQYRNTLNQLWNEYINHGNHSLGNANSTEESYIKFLIGLDRQYFSQMKSEILHAAQEIVPITGTQLSFGGFANLLSHTDMDYFDTHFYVDHYNYPSTRREGGRNRKDPENWRIQNISLVGTGLRSLLQVAVMRRIGVPFTVSEYNQPWPNTKGAEIAPVVASFAAFQDWDALIYFDYDNAADWDRGAPGGFSLNGDWTKIVNIGQASQLFRRELISTARSTYNIAINDKLIINAALNKILRDEANYLESLIDYNKNLPLLHKTQITINSATNIDQPVDELSKATITSDTGELKYDQRNKLLSIVNENIAAIFGVLQPNTDYRIGLIELRNPNSDPNFVSAMLTSIDGQPLNSSHRMLLTIPGPTWRSIESIPQPQKLSPHSLGGLTLYSKNNDLSSPLHGRQLPTWMDLPELIISFKRNAESINIYPLDGKANRLNAISRTKISESANEFSFHLNMPNDKSISAPWYEIIIK